MFEESEDEALAVPAPRSSSHFSDQFSRSADEPEHKEMRFGASSSSSNAVFPGNRAVLLDTHPVLNQHGSGLSTGAAVSDAELPDESSEASAAPERWLPVPSWLGWSPLPPVPKVESRQSRPEPARAASPAVSRQSHPYTSAASSASSVTSAGPSHSREAPVNAASAGTSYSREVPTSAASPRPSDRREVLASSASGGLGFIAESPVSAASDGLGRQVPVSAGSAGLIDGRETLVNQGSASYSSEPGSANQIGAPLSVPVSMLEASAGANGPPTEFPSAVYTRNQDGRHDLPQRDDSSAQWDAGEAAAQGTLLPIHQVSHRPHPAQRPKKEHHQTPMGRVFLDIASAYARSVPARRPCCCACFGFVVVIAVTGVGMVLRPPEVETNFDSFMKTDVNSSTMRDGFMAALSARDGDARRLRRTGATLFSLFDIFVAYELTEESSASSIFEKHVIEEISRFENKLTSQAGWKAFCETTLEETQGFCMPGLSIANYVMPHLEIPLYEVVPDKMTFNGQGKEMVPIGTTLRLLQDFELSRILMPEDYNKNDPKAVKVVRSAFRFRFYCCQSTDSGTYQSKQVKEFQTNFHSFLTETVLPFLEDYSPGSDSPGQALPFNVWYASQGLETIQVMQTLLNDIGLAAGSMLFVLGYIVFHTRSIFLSLMGVFIILFSVPFSYVVFAMTTGTSTMSIASFLSLFLIVGLGSDVIFVYTDFWRDSIRIRENEADRIVWTLFYAGKASLATTITTALSFFANLASVLKPLREFGMFMGLCVTLVWLLITLIFLPLCVVDERYFTCCNIRCSSDRRGPSKIAQILGKWEAGLFRWRRLCISCSFLLTVLALVFSIMNAETDTQLPAIFPADHNQNRGKKTMQQFESPKDVFDALYTLPDTDTQVCREYGFNADDDKCALFWCEVNPRLEWSEGSDTCQCWQSEEQETDAWSEYFHVVQRFIGRKEFTNAELNGPVTDHILKLSGEGANIAGKGLLEMAPILLQEWETGDVMMKDMVQVQTTLKKGLSQNGRSWQELCFCGSYVCQLPNNFRPVESLNFERRLANVESLSLERRMSMRSQTVATHALSDVAVVFGIDVTAGSPLLGTREKEAAWSFQEGFQIAQPWAQRNIIYLCDNLPEDLRAVNVRCFLKDFRRWLTDRRERFPVPESRFHSLAWKYSQIGLTGGSSSKDYIWVKDRKVLAMYVSVVVDFNKHSAADPVMKYKELWNQRIDEWNSQASRFARGAWHSSNLWVRAEAQQELISSTILTLLIVIIMAFVGMLIFTFDPLLSLFVVASTIGVISGLFFFMTCVMRWAIGPIEVIALIVFIGYAVTYSLHITHKYGDGEALTSEPPRLDLDERISARYQRTGFALKSIGSAALGSAATTCGCSVFLLFCTLTIFQKLGGVVLAVTVMSIAMALGPLPAALLVFGPLNPGKKCCPKPQDCEDFWSQYCECCRGTWVKPRDLAWQQRSGAYLAQEGQSGAMPLADGHAVGHSHDGRGIEAERPVSQGVLDHTGRERPVGQAMPDHTGRQVPPRLGDSEEQLVFITKSERASQRQSGQQVAPRSPVKSRYSAGGNKRGDERNQQDRGFNVPVKVDDLQLEFNLDPFNSAISTGELDIGEEEVLDPIRVRQALPMGSIPQRKTANARIKKPGGDTTL